MDIGAVKTSRSLLHHTFIILQTCSTTYHLVTAHSSVLFFTYYTSLHLIHQQLFSRVFTPVFFQISRPLFPCLAV